MGIVIQEADKAFYIIIVSHTTCDFLRNPVMRTELRNQLRRLQYFELGIRYSPTYEPVILCFVVRFRKRFKKALPLLSSMIIYAKKMA